MPDPSSLIEFDLDWLELLRVVSKMAVAFLLAIPIAWDRETSTRQMGLRTFPLVAMASCAVVLVAIAQLPDNGDAQARIIQGLITGIGFIGGGAILKDGAGVSGTATAASIWGTGAIGAAVAYGHYEIAIVLMASAFLVLRLLGPIKQSMDEKDRPARP